MKEEFFRRKAIEATTSGVVTRQVGFNLLNSNYRDDYGSSLDIIKNVASANLALSAEHFLKASTLYFDLKDSSYINSVFGTSELDSKITDLLKKPENIQRQIIQSNDARKNISLNFDSSSRTKVSGHDLYAYFQIQNPIIKALINHEYLSNDGEDIFNWIDFGILTHDIFKEDDGKIYLPKKQVDFLNANKENFINDRYVYANDGSRITSDADLKFLLDFTGGLGNLMKYLFPNLEKLDKINFSESKLQEEVGSNVFGHYRLTTGMKNLLSRLDKISYHCLMNEFNQNEFENLLNTLKLIDGDSNVLDKENFKKIFVNLCIYLKHCSSECQTGIIFDYNVFNRIKKYCKILSNVNSFDPNMAQFKDTSIFINKKDELKDSFAETRESTMLEKQIVDAGAITNKMIISNKTDGKIPILLSGASKTSWPKISSENQSYIKLLTQVLANLLNHNTTYLITGGTNFGVEKEMHSAIYRRNLNKSNSEQLLVLGTLVLEALNDKQIEENTITHGVVLEVNGHKARTWDDLAKVQPEYIKRCNGELICIGGGKVVEKMIEEGKKLDINMHLMKGITGASGDFSEAVGFENYSFKSIKDLLQKIYMNNSDSFVADFSLDKVDEYCKDAINELLRAQSISELEARQLLEKNTSEKIIDNYKKVDIYKYVRDGITSGNLNICSAEKVSKIFARKGNVGEIVVSYSVDSSGNEVVEKVDSVQLDEKTKKSGWVVTKLDKYGDMIIDENGHYNQWIISDSTFKQKYEVDSEERGIYKPKSNIQTFVQLSENIILSQDGNDMKIAAGGFVNITNPDEIYGISERDFYDTYEIVNNKNITKGL